ncbi:hypothetical protein [Clostridium sp. DJ247]|uniref:hypothetical protein n=1 Tax=Clostridium sp. DJ247 TaxID=2726188 RepID=UPI001A9BDB5D|nr:hypothetical protein [Clostridium sp. DJ247]
MDMMESNITTQLSFSNLHINALFVENVENYYIYERTIVINVGTDSVYFDEPLSKDLKIFNSTIVKDIKIKKASAVILISICDEINIGNVILEKGWNLLGDILPKDSTFPKNTPLWRSSQESITTVSLDPLYITGQITTSVTQKNFEIKVNLWFAPALTNCVIHNTHDFIEFHTQIYGLGRMQKFKTQDSSTLYEDIFMSEGYTTPVPFCNVEEDSNYIYPWHQYYADTDCIWLAIEYHPVK